MASRNSATSPPLKIKIPPKSWPTSRSPFATSHIVCQPPSLPPPTKPRLLLLRPTPLLSPQALAPPGRGKRGHQHLPHQPQPRLRTLNTSYHSTIPSLARPSANPKSTLGCLPTAMRPENTREAHMTSPLSPPATYIQTTTRPPPMLSCLWLWLGWQGQVKSWQATLPPNMLRVRSPLPGIRGLPPSQVPNVAFLLLASSLPLTQRLQPLQQPFPI